MWQKTKNIYHLVVAFTAAIFFKFPSRKIIVIGVTGTDGKTTTVNIIYHILKSSGEKVSMISSVNARIGQKDFDTGFHVTTPNPWQIQKYLNQAVKSKSKYFILEATSHGLDQNRLAFVKFKIAAITNITHEHLDYHTTWQNYAKAKAKLFKQTQFSILNFDDKKSYEFLKNRSKGKIITYSLKDKSNISLKNFPIKLKIPGEYNLANALAASAACTALGIDKKTIIKSLASFQKVKGRMEEVNLGQDFKVIIDFAHTPNALKQALKTLDSKLRTQNSKLIAVFGAAGQRDKTKRPLMGKIAGKLADIIVLTAEDPRTEEVEDICHQIKKGVKGKKENKNLFIITDRKQAIEFAITKLARKNDIVAVFGKSHEKSICFGKKEYPWNEYAVVKSAIRKKLKLNSH